MEKKEISVSFRVTQTVKNRMEKLKRDHNWSAQDYWHDKFTEDYLEISGLQKKLEQTNKEKEALEQRQKELLEQIKQIKDLDAQLESNLTRDMKYFLKRVPKLLEEGKDVVAIYNRFVSEFNATVKIKDFSRLVEKVNGIKHE